jgi:hypothetical protein
MVKCKILFYNKKPSEVEDLVNDWLSEHPNIEIKAATMQPNFAFAIFYEEK